MSARHAPDQDLPLDTFACYAQPLALHPDDRRARLSLFVALMRANGCVPKR